MNAFIGQSFRWALTSKRAPTFPRQFCYQLQWEAGQHFAIFFAAPATRGMVKGTVIWPPPGPRTHSKYDCDDATPYRNLRAVKLGPRGGVWEQTYVEVIGPPVETVRDGPLHCWLCNAELTAQQRQWTRPGWKRRVTWSERKPQLPDYLLEEERRARAEGDLRACNRSGTVASETWQGHATPTQKRSSRANST